VGANVARGNNNVRREDNKKTDPEEVGYEDVELMQPELLWTATERNNGTSCDELKTPYYDI
jgi:hypothetical protein